MLKVVGDKYGIDKVKRVQDWVTWTAGRRDPFPLNGSLDPRVLHTVSTVLTEGKAGGPKQSGKHWKALAAWLTESQAETERKRLGLEGTLNQREAQGEMKQEKWKQMLAQLALQDGGEKTPAGAAKGIYPVLEEETGAEGADIQQCPMVQTGENEWVWRSWTPQDVRGLKANMEEHLKGNPRKAIKILHDQITMHGATRTDIGFICTVVLPSSIWGAHSAAWGVKPEHEVDDTLNRRNLPEAERARPT